MSLILGLCFGLLLLRLILLYLRGIFLINSIRTSSVSILLPIHLIVPNIITPESVGTSRTTMHLLIFTCETFVNIDASHTFYSREDKHHVICGYHQLCLIDSLLDRPTIVSIPNQHHYLYAATKSNDHHLTIMHGRVAEIVDPQGDQVHGSRQETKRICTAEC